MSIKIISLIIIRVKYKSVIQIVSADQLGEEHIRVSAHSPGGILANLETRSRSLDQFFFVSPQHQRYPPHRWESFRISPLNPKQSSGALVNLNIIWGQLCVVSALSRGYWSIQQFHISFVEIGLRGQAKLAAFNFNSAQ